LLLRSGWDKLFFVVSMIPILVIKNGVRIVTLYLLAAYVNPAFLHGWVHTTGGIVFYLLGLILLIPVPVLLRRWEDRRLAQLPLRVVAV
jgi:exosortase/archaeosortase family protein